ncbi:MAG: prepilin-type N-terminal cleavage/methylation domain-containing protein, partial [Gammaproteobacteria bacterium]|nr:prepilin-type N-terminal cleavage/methylation domain-containing protein [Gammaproteobacteria bacterium]
MNAMIYLVKKDHGFTLIELVLTIII